MIRCYNQFPLKADIDLEDIRVKVLLKGVGLKGAWFDRWVDSTVELQSYCTELGLYSTATICDIGYLIMYICTCTEQVLLVKEGLDGALEHVCSCLHCLDKLGAPQSPDPPEQVVLTEAPLVPEEQTGEETGDTCNKVDTSDDEMVIAAAMVTMVTKPLPPN